MSKKIITITSFFLLSLIVHAQNKKNPADNILGRWMSQKKSGIIEIYKHGAKFYGKLVWIKDSIDNQTKQPKKDKKNPDIKSQSRELKGLVLLNSFQYVGENNYKEGNIYDPESGKIYSCKMHLSEDLEKLEIRGFVGISLIGRTESWSRVRKLPK